MKEELEKIESMQKQLQQFMDIIYAKHKNLSREVVFAGMVIKKTIYVLLRNEKLHYQCSDFIASFVM